MRKLVYTMAFRLWPRLDRLNSVERETGVANVFAVIYSAPLVMVGFAWLISETDVQLFWDEAPLFALFTALIYILGRLDFFMITEIKSGVFADVNGSMENIVIISAALLFGPSALWIGLVWPLSVYLYSLSRKQTAVNRWNQLRNLTMELSRLTLGLLIALAAYESLGGVYPFPRISPAAVAPALGLIAMTILTSMVIYMPLMLFWSTSAILSGSAKSTQSLIAFFISLLGWPIFVNPFALLTAAQYTQNSLFGYLFMNFGLVLVSVMTHRLSIAVERNRRRSIELEKLEALSRAMLNAPPGDNVLPSVLREHLTGMFAYTVLDIRLFPHTHLLHMPEARDPLPEAMWEWFTGRNELRYFPPDALPPWTAEINRNAIILVPINDVESGEQIGGIALMFGRYLIDHDASAAQNIVPAVQSVASQIASALHRAQNYQQTLAHQRTQQELVLAGEIQASFLPDTLPEISGWQLTAYLEPARQTSGDFYDIIPLPGNRWGIVVADVADKGMGAALFMSLTRTLIRIFAAQYPTDPHQALAACNERIMQDTNSDLFVTVFYGILEPTTGRFIYCNAGHNPPFWLRSTSELQRLGRTGIPVGLFDTFNWTCSHIMLEAGEALVLYTDGLTEAERDDEWFGEDQMTQLLIQQQGASAQVIHDSLKTSVNEFLAGQSLTDDLTLVVLSRDS